MLDEYYAEDIAQRAKDSVAYRKSQGKTIGAAPYGTKRNTEGYLTPTDEGAWLLSDGTFIAGTADKCPIEDSVWRGYYDGLQMIMSLYATDEKGLESIAYALNEAGYAFQANRVG